MRHVLVQIDSNKTHKSHSIFYSILYSLIYYYCLSLLLLLGLCWCWRCDCERCNRQNTFYMCLRPCGATLPRFMLVKVKHQAPTITQYPIEQCCCCLVLCFFFFLFSWVKNRNIILIVYPFEFLLLSSVRVSKNSIRRFSASMELNRSLRCDLCVAFAKPKTCVYDSNSLRYTYSSTTYSLRKKLNTTENKNVGHFGANYEYVRVFFPLVV